MSIASQITTMQEHIEDIYDTFAVAGVDTSAAAKNIVNINANLKERLEYYLANGLDVVWNNWNKVSGSGTTLSLNNTIQAKMDFVYKGNTSQSILPSGYTQVDYITSDGNSYIDTGKALGDNFKIETKFIHNQQSSNEQPIISTWVNSYAWFNLYIASNNQLRFYAAGNHMTANPTLTIGNINTVSYSRNSNEWVGTLNGEEVTFTTELTSSNPTTFKILARGDGTKGSYVSIYRLKLFENNILTMDLIPCYRNSDNVIGMYDIVNNIFYTNSGTGNFTYGSIAPNPECPIPVNVVTGDNEVKVEGKNLFNANNYMQQGGYNGISIKNNKDGSYTITGTATGNVGLNLTTTPIILKNGETYTQSIIGISGTQKGSLVPSFKNSQGQIIYNFFSNNQTKTTTDVMTLNNYDYFISNGTTVDFTFKVQLEQGSSATEFQLYQSQTYPINLGSMELCKIGDYQDYIAKSSGKNLFDKNNINLINNYYVDSTGKIIAGNFNKFNWIKLQPNTTYTLSQPKKSPVTIRITLFDTQPEANATGTILGTFATTDGIIQTFTTTNNGIYLGWVYCNTSSLGGYTEQEMLDSIMLNEGTTALPYEPYGKVWYKYGAIGKVVLDGSNSEGWGTIWDSAPNVYKTYSIIPSLYRSSSRSEIICVSDYYTATYYDGGNQSMWRLKDNDNYHYLICIGDNETRKGNVFIKNVDMATAEDLKTWLSTHNTTVYYVLNTPTVTEITDTALISQLEAIKLSYNEQTNISQTNTDKPFILDVTALKDLDAEDTTPALTTNQGLLFTQPPVSESSINDEDDNSILEETINEEEPNIEDNNREEEEPVDFFEKEIINNDEEQEEIPTEPIEIDNGQR